MLGPAIGGAFAVVLLTLYEFGMLQFLLKREMPLLVIVMSYYIGAFPALITGMYAGWQKKRKGRLNLKAYYLLSGASTYLMILASQIHLCFFGRSFSRSCELQEIFVLEAKTFWIVLIGLATASILYFVTNLRPKKLVV
jgi:hypothetical protein